MLHIESGVVFILTLIIIIFGMVFGHICENGGAVHAYLVGLLPRVANEEVPMAQCQAHSGPSIMFVE